MALTSLAERQARLDQQRARLQREEAKIREDARKARTRALIEAGALVEKAGLAELDANALYGALRELAARVGDPDALARWRAEGGRAFDREAKARAAEKEPLILTLAGAQPALVTARLRSLGFRWSKVLQHWEGLATFRDAQAAAAELGGTLRRLAPPAAPSDEPTAPGTARDAAE
ncbi:conjugal transfer protein TraD [Rubellimicrobium aerolatum]|uniref:Conjugal transfer protein TraD n=1 Tax=Rubellimicrobium aerolatum TaxID=490979 RepID=A0ABW0SEK0_9RHOB|nr:conjugal transfer protein TraD [Rubellimicrobium aerolatum]MBP1806915.1 multidrug efflux pump subunit AcrA (membrane-fusion protein) [Rubellimicrobium aerolatum]